MSVKKADSLSIHCHINNDDDIYFGHRNQFHILIFFLCFHRKSLNINMWPSGDISGARRQLKSIKSNLIQSAYAFHFHIELTVTQCSSAYRSTYPDQFRKGSPILNWSDLIDLSTDG